MNFHRVSRRGAVHVSRRGKIIFGLAACADRSGDRETARTLIAKRRTDHHVVSPDTLKAMGSMELRWKHQDHLDCVEAAMRERKFAEALALFDELINQTDNFAVHASLVRQRRSLAQDCALAFVDAAINARDFAEARAKIAELMRGDELQGRARRHLNERLEILDEMDGGLRVGGTR